ncbi:QRFP-like peptide receptor [Saccostrea echinata]|uniref:QRFP-like peptide receptor n=1 Tax=Saccostrea echinata TaxID=191078 RepID=UPI002A7F76A3|nr:QRFP-like peptide receptor [Saccostrea echinata]
MKQLVKMNPISASLIAVDFLLIFTITFTNTFAIVLILKKSKRNSKNLLLVSLSLSDIAVAVFVIPNVIFLKLHNSSISPVICQICLYAEYMASAANVFSISVLAMDRFRALVYPLKNRGTRREAVYGSIVLIWIACLFYAIRAPVVFRGKMFKVGSGNSTDVKYGCAIPDPILSLHAGFIVLDFIILFVIPALILISCNVKVSLELCNKTPVTSTMPETVGKRRRRAVRILLILILLFIVLNFPLHCFRMARHVFKQTVSEASTIGHVLLILTFTNNSLNVFFYALLNEDIKTVFLTCCKGRRNQVAPSTSSTNRAIQQSTRNTNVSKCINQS